MAILQFGLSIALFLAGGIAAEICRGKFTRPRGASRGKRRVKRRSFLLPTPLGYEGLEGLRTGSDDDTQGLVMGSRLGFGSYGVVYNGRWRGARVAVKILEHGGRNKKESMQVAREAAVGAALSHPNVVKVFFVSTRRLDSVANPFALETAIVMEFCDQDTLRSRHEVIWELIQKDSAAGLRWIISCLIDIAGALDYMHTLGLVHGDLKCNNILLQSTRSEARGFTCKIADMGCSRLLSTSLEVLTGTFGAPCYAAPELMKDGSLTQASDVFSFAIIAWHLLSCGDKFFEMNIARLYCQVVDFNVRPSFPERTNIDLKHLIESCWLTTPSARPSFEQVVIALVTMQSQCL